MLTLIAIITAMSAHAQPSLTTLEQARGFKFLSGPDATSKWRGYKQPSFPAKGWTAKDGVLTVNAGGGGGDIITTDQYGDFELILQYKTAPKANSGIIYRVTEKHGASYQTGPEFQILDDAGHSLKPTDAHSAGALYDMYSPAEGKKTSADWNDARIYIRNGVIQHWLNGVKVVDVVAFDSAGKATPEWKAKIAAGKFKDTDGFGVQPKGHIALQEHGDEVAFRNIKIRDLNAAAPGERQLFNGKDLTGLETVVPDAAKKGIKPESVWSVSDGVLVCSGDPPGYIRTKDKYTNFILRFQWRFSPVTKKAGNSGVLFRMTGEDKVWPKSLEAQLMSGNAGDFYGIDGFKYTGDPARMTGRHTKKTHGAERPVGEWNEYEIIVNKGDVVLYVNGEELNRATGVEEVPGFICLQSEGAEIHFRDVRLVPLD
jgi:hypothetical protein